MNTFERLSLIGLVPVIAIDDSRDAVPLCQALSDGGLPVAEITFRTAAAEEAIRLVHEELPHVLLCAGTVLTRDQADRAVKAGASAVVSPGLDAALVGYCLQNGIPVCPGTATPRDVEAAIVLGLDTVKFFPAEQAGGLKMIKALCGPFPQMKFMPTGGINEDNMLSYLADSHVLCCGGSWMVPKDAVKAKDWGRITEITRSAVNKMLGLALSRIGLYSETGAEAADSALLLARLMGCAVSEKEGAQMAGNVFSVIPETKPGVKGQIVLSANNIRRAKWHLENRGFVFDEDSAAFNGDKMNAVSLKDKIAGFEICIEQK